MPPWLWVLLALPVWSGPAPFVIRYRSSLLPHAIPSPSSDAPAPLIPYDRFHLCGVDGILAVLQPLQRVHCQRLCNYSYPEDEMAQYVAAIKAMYRGALFLESNGRAVDLIAGYPPSVKVGTDWQRTGQWLETGYPIGLPGHQHGRGKTRINNHLAFEVLYSDTVGSIDVVNFTAVAHTYHHTAATCSADDRRNVAWQWDVHQQPLHQKVFPKQMVVYSYSVTWRPQAAATRDKLSAPVLPGGVLLAESSGDPTQRDRSLPSAFLPFCPRVQPVSLQPLINVTCGVLCRVTYNASQMAAIIVQIKRDARAGVTVGGMEAVESTHSSTGSPALLRGWPVGIRGHINGHHNARLNNHVALHVVVDNEDHGRTLSVLATPHSTRLSVQCSPDDTANQRAHWVPDGTGPQAQRATASQPVVWTYALTWSTTPPVEQALVEPSTSKSMKVEAEAEQMQLEVAEDPEAVGDVVPQGITIPLSGVIVLVVACANLVICRRAWRQAHQMQQSRRQRSAPSHPPG